MTHDDACRQRTGGLATPPSRSGNGATGTLVFVPYWGWMAVPSESCLPERPGPQKHNGGITPGYRHHRGTVHKCHIAERLAEAEALLGEALLRIARLEGGE